MLTKNKIFRQLGLGDVYIAEDMADVRLARSNGLPYIKKPNGWDERKFMAVALYQFLKNKFPDIIWSKVFGFAPKTKLTLHVQEVAAGQREFIDPDGNITDGMQVSDGYRESISDTEQDSSDWKEKDLA
jgi:hypothetical protein